MDEQSLITATNLACNVGGKAIGSEGRKNRGKALKSLASLTIERG